MQNRDFLCGQLRKLLLAPPNLKSSSAVFRLKSWLTSIAELTIQVLPADVRGDYQNWSVRRHRPIPNFEGAVWWVQTLQEAIVEARKPLEPEGIALHFLSGGELRKGTPETLDLPNGRIENATVDGETVEEIVVMIEGLKFHMSFEVIVVYTLRAAGFLCDAAESSVRSRPRGDIQMPPLPPSKPEPSTTRPPSVQNLFDAIINVEGHSQMFLDSYSKAREVSERSRAPKPDEYPDRAEVRHRRLAEALARTAEDRKAKGESVDDLIPMSPTEWEDTLSELKESYVDWQRSIEVAISFLTAAASVLNAGERRDHERWTTKAKLELQTLSGLLHRDRVGPDAMGLARTGFPPLPKQFTETLFAIAQRRLYLMGVTKKPRSPSKVRGPRRSDKVLTLLRNPPPEGWTTPSLATAVGYRSHSSLYRVKGFKDAWAAYEKVNMNARAAITPKA